MIDFLGEHAWSLFIVLGGFLVDWLAIACRWQRLKPLTKIVAILNLLLWTLNAANWQFDPFTIILLSAQLFGMVGDIFLLFSARLFIWGLLSFLIGHIFYLSLSTWLVSEQLRMAKPESLFWLAGLSAAIWSVLMVCIYRFFGSAYKKRHDISLMWAGIQGYMWILSGLVILNFFLILIQPVFSWTSMLLTFGAALFLISDFLLAMNRFIREFRLAQLWVRITYHLAQLFLAIGFLVLK